MNILVRKIAAIVYSPSFYKMIRNCSGARLDHKMSLANAKDAAKRIVWVDLEMTGLDIEKDQILEIACLVTDAQLNLVATGPNLVIHQPDHVLDAMNPWCVAQHGEEDFKTQALLKLDEEVKMISAEAPVLFAKAAEIFIHELTLRAWSHTEDNKRRTLQRNDIAMAISLSDQFDFLIDIVPRHEVKSVKTTSWTKPEPTTTHEHTTNGTNEHATPNCVATVLATSADFGRNTEHFEQRAVQQPVTLLQQVVTPSGEVQNMPSQIQLTPAQLNLIRLQVQNNPTQPIIIQTQPQQSPQIIQVTSQAQHQPQQQVYLAQVATSQDDS